MIAVLILAFFIIRPFVGAILISLVLAYIFYPAYKFINKKIKNKNAASFIATIIVIFLILVPFFFILNAVSREALSLYSTSKDKLFTGEFFAGECVKETEDLSCKITNFFRGAFSHPQIQPYLEKTIKDATTFFVEKIRDFLFSIPAKVLNFFVMIFVVFFLFRDGKGFVEKVEGLLPLKKAHKKKVFVKLNDAAFAVIYGSIIVAIIQGTLGGIGFFAVGIKNPLMWAVMMMFFALVPFVGTATIWLPASLILIFSGYLASDTMTIIKGFALLVYGTFVISFIDNLIKPKIIGDRAKVHPVLILLGVIGGIHFFGFVGIVIGPIIFALLATFIKIYEEEGYL